MTTDIATDIPEPKPKPKRQSRRLSQSPVTCLQRILEGALLAAGKPLTVEELSVLFDQHERPNNDAIRATLALIADQCTGRGFQLREVASGFRFQVIQDVAPWIARLWEEKRAALQPSTAGDAVVDRLPAADHPRRY